MASLFGSIILPDTAIAAVMSIPQILADLGELDERLQDRENQTDPDTLQFSAALMEELSALFGVSKRALGLMLGISDEKTVRGWFKGEGVPRRGAILIARLMTERLVEPPASEGVEGVADCLTALRPHLDFLLRRAKGAGWEEDDVLRSILQWIGQRAS